MRKIIFTFLACCLIYTNTFAWDVQLMQRAVVQKVTSGGGCATQSTLLDKSGAFGANTPDIDSSSIVSAFAVTGNGKDLYSVTFKTGTAGQGSSATFRVYVNTSLDFSGTNVYEENITTPGTTETEFTLTLATPTTLTNSTTYYIALADPDGAWGTRCGLTMIADVAQNAYYSSTGLGGSFTQNSSSKSIWAIVKTCD